MPRMNSRRQSVFLSSSFLRSLPRLNEPDLSGPVSLLMPAPVSRHFGADKRVLVRFCEINTQIIRLSEVLLKVILSQLLWAMAMCYQRHAVYKYWLVIPLRSILSFKTLIFHSRHRRSAYVRSKPSSLRHHIASPTMSRAAEPEERAGREAWPRMAATNGRTGDPSLWRTPPEGKKGEVQRHGYSTSRDQKIFTKVWKLFFS